MTENIPEETPFEVRLASLLDEYHRAIREGTVPDPDAMLDRHPELATELGDCLRGLAAMEELSHALKSDHAAASPPSPAEFGDFQIVREIGRGGMGVVFEAMHRHLKRRVALKMIRSGSLADQRDRDLFRKEALAAASLHHPNIVQLFELGDAAGEPYLVLEYVDGGTLAARLAGTPLDPREAAPMLACLARAIHYAHERGIVHRDLKPGNVLLTREPSAGSASTKSALVPKIADFGLAKLLHEDELQTQSGAIKGTPSYMAPEQATGGTSGAVADVYALGAIFYETLTGRPPFRAATALDTLSQVVTMEPVAPTRLQPKVPRDLETICLKCLRKEPEQRYPSALALAEDLERFLRHEPIAARPVGLIGRVWRWGRRNPTVAMLLAASLGLMLFVVVLLGIRLVDERITRERILAENVFAANHLASTILVELWKAAEAVDEMAADPELRRRLKEDRQKIRPFPAGKDASSARFTLAADQRRLQPYLEIVHRRSGYAFHSWHVVDDKGILLADVPLPAKSVFGVSFEGRDYFIGALRHAGTPGRARVHVSRAYKSSNDELYKCSLSAVVYDDDRKTVLGVICATLPTGFLEFADAEHTTVLVGRSDANDPHQKPALQSDSSEHMILAHPAYSELADYQKGRNAVRIPAALMPLVAVRVENHDELVPPHRSATKASRARHNGYEDPLGALLPAKYGGQWLAGFAQVGNTEMVVIVQRRANETTTDRYWLLVEFVILLGCVVAAVCALRARRRSASPIPLAEQAPTITFKNCPKA